MFYEGKQIGLYTLIRKLGRGGFGEIWLAERRAKFVTTKVAVKLPLDEQIDHETIKQEAMLWEQASGHPNILPIIDADEYDGQIVIVSEYAPDGSLEQWLIENGKMPIEKAVEMTIQILDGLEFLHSRNIIHRDIKPANILLQGKTPRLADFGISRAMRTTMASQSQHISGTFAYMSPEALDGKRSVQTDIWSVGVNLYQFLTGMLPFPQKEFTQLLTAIAVREPEPLPDFVPPELKRIIAKSLEKLCRNRYKTANEMSKNLKRFLRKNSEQTLESSSYSVLPVETPPEIIKPVLSDFASTVKDIIVTSKATEVLVPPEKTDTSLNTHLSKVSDNLSYSYILSKICKITCIVFSVICSIFGLIAIVFFPDIFVPLKTFYIFHIPIVYIFLFFQVISIIFGLIHYYLTGAIGKRLFAKGLAVIPILLIIFLFPATLYTITGTLRPSIATNLALIFLLILYIVLPITYSTTALIVKKVDLWKRFIPIVALTLFIIINVVISLGLATSGFIFTGSIAWILLSIPIRLPLLTKLRSLLIKPETKWTYLITLPVGVLLMILVVWLLLFTFIFSKYWMNEKPEVVNVNSANSPMPSVTPSYSFNEENILQIDYVGRISEINTVKDLVEFIESNCPKCSNNQHRQRIIDSIRRINKSIYENGKREELFSDDEILNLDLSKISGAVVFEVYDCCDLLQTRRDHFRLNERFLREKYKKGY